MQPNWRYPPAEPRESGRLAVSHGHTLYWEEYGNPQGTPVVVLHGGPGGACNPFMARVFDPARYRALLFDQRGCGLSTPSAADADASPALNGNDTPHLIQDILALMDARNMERAHVFGGSWGSTLALAFAIDSPERVRSLVLRGIFLCRREDLDYFYQGNAAYYARDPLDSRLPGAYQFYPEAWRDYVEAIPPAERGDMVRAYAARFARNPATPEEDAALTRVAAAWSIWEGVTSFLHTEPELLARFGDPAFARAFARIENHYFLNGAFLGGQGEANRNQNYLLEHAHRLNGIPIHIVHGRFDQVCPLSQALELVRAIRQVGGNVTLAITTAGHSMLEEQTLAALTDIMDTLADQA